MKTGAGTLFLNGANTFTGRTRVLEGTLGGDGSLAGDLIVSDATFAPGNSAGLFTVAGGFDATSANFVFEIGGTIRGDDYDALDVGGTFRLLGGPGNELSPTFIDGFEAGIQFTDTFDLVTGGGLTGEFGNVANGERLFTTDGLGSFVVHYGAGSLFGAGKVVLSDYVSAIPEPASAGLLGALAAGASVGLRRRRGVVRGGAAGA